MSSAKEQIKRLRDLDRLRCKIYSSMGEILHTMRTEVLSDVEKGVEWGGACRKIYDPDGLTSEEWRTFIAIYQFNKICSDGGLPLPLHVYMHRIIEEGAEKLGSGSEED